MSKLADYWNSIFTKLNAAAANTIAPKGNSNQPTVTPSNQQMIDQQHAGTYDPLFHGADRYPLQALAALRTKKVFQKVIGAKYNKNDEINHIAEQSALVIMGLAQLAKPEEQTRAELRAWTKNVQG